jgi:hypothetical protein
MEWLGAAIAAGIGGAFALAGIWLRDRTRRRLGLPGDIEDQIIGSLQTLNSSLRDEAEQRKAAEQACLSQLAAETARTTRLELRVDDLERQNTRLQLTIRAINGEPT